MTDRLGLRQLEPDAGGLEQLRQRIDQRRHRVAGIQAATGLAVMLGLTAVLKLPGSEPLPAWAADQPALRVTQSTPGRVTLVNGRQRTLARTSAMTLVLIDSGSRPQEPATPPT
ncbi:MAG: hypothetical protein QNJ40_06525 [Xanthomonadales bacterium]|nr:hypothetical protein [Xanthomonadales bacterium]